MIRVAKDHPVIVCDLDGCIVANPHTEGTIQEWDFWHSHWTEPRAATIQHEVVDVVQAMRETGHFLIILTARPEYFAPWTLEVLMRADLFPTLVSDGDEFIGDLIDDSILVMMPGDKIASSAQWKRDKIAQWLKDGMDIRLVIEDYPPNAEAIRELVPVFLYESKRKSRHGVSPTVESKAESKRTLR